VPSSAIHRGDASRFIVRPDALRVFGVGVLSEQHAGLFPGDFLHDVVDDLGFWLIPWTRTLFIVREHYIPRHPSE
jgi:hypothetical protein